MQRLHISPLTTKDINRLNAGLPEKTLEENIINLADLAHSDLGHQRESLVSHNTGVLVFGKSGLLLEKNDL